MQRNFTLGHGSHRSERASQNGRIRSAFFTTEDTEDTEEHRGDTRAVSHPQLKIVQMCQLRFLCGTLCPLWSNLSSISVETLIAQELQ